MQSVIDACAIAILWIASIICIGIMKKIQSNAWKYYAVYVLGVCIIFTVFAALHLYLR